MIFQLNLLQNSYIIFIDMKEVCIMMSLTKKLKYAMIETNVNQIELANRTNQSQSNLSKKMKIQD